MLVSSVPSYLTSSTKNGCPTNSVLRRRRGASVPTYMVKGTREPVTSMRNPWNVPAGTVTAWRTHLEREHLDGILARREEGHREGLAGSERQGGHDERDGVLVHRSRRQHRIDLEALHRAVRLRSRTRAFHPASGVGQVGLGLLALLGRHLIDLPHHPAGGLEHERGLLLEGAVREVRPLGVQERIRRRPPNL